MIANLLKPYGCKTATAHEKVYFFYFIFQTEYSLFLNDTKINYET